MAGRFIEYAGTKRHEQVIGAELLVVRYVGPLGNTSGKEAGYGFFQKIFIPVDVVIVHFAAERHMVVHLQKISIILRILNDWNP